MAPNETATGPVALGELIISLIVDGLARPVNDHPEPGNCNLNEDLLLIVLADSDWSFPNMCVHCRCGLK